jgi:hypothetical protein
VLRAHTAPASPFASEQCASCPSAQAGEIKNILKFYSLQYNHCLETLRVCYLMHTASIWLLSISLQFSPASLDPVYLNRASLKRVSLNLVSLDLFLRQLSPQPISLSACFPQPYFFPLFTFPHFTFPQHHSQPANLFALRNLRELTQYLFTQYSLSYFTT